MMSIEGPFVAAVIARVAEPKYNLAAYGVAFSLALIVEAPIIMIMSASTALVRDRHSLVKMRNFTFLLNGLITVTMLIMLIPSNFDWIARDLIELPEPVANLTYYAVMLLLPWPAAIGFRRFYQGILIRQNLTRRVAYGTVIRLTTMGSTAMGLFLLSSWEGAYIGAMALSVGVTMEAIVTRLMAHQTLKIVCRTTDKSRDPLTYPEILHFYYPLALSSMLSLSTHPMVTFFVGQSRMAIESLAVLPVINSLSFIFRSFGLAYQEVGIALVGDNFEGYRKLRTFAIRLSIVLVAAVSLIAFTPLSRLWFHTVSGLTPELTAFAIVPFQTLVIFPALMVLIAFQRSILVTVKKTRYITIATAMEIVMIIAMLFFLTKVVALVGALAVTLAYVAGRSSACAYLMYPLIKTRRAYQIDD